MITCAQQNLLLSSRAHFGICSVDDTDTTMTHGWTIAAAIWLCLVVSSATASTTLSRPGVERLFTEWMEAFQKEYDNPEELALRMEIWYENHGM